MTDIERMFGLRSKESLAELAALKKLAKLVKPVKKVKKVKKVKPVKKVKYDMYINVVPGVSRVYNPHTVSHLVRRMVYEEPESSKQ